VRVSFAERHDEVLVMPDGRQVRAALVVMEASRAAEARELARWLAREWGLPEVATLRGGFEAWQRAGLPVE
jgi:3-mercaptopyruvate sulfurtransferase SseA